MEVREAMTTQVQAILPTGTLLEAAQKMLSHDVGAVPVVDEGTAVGIVTDRDITLRAVAEGMNPVTTPVSEVMSRDVVWCNQADDVKEAAKIMKERAVRRVLVRDDEQNLAGMLSLGDLADEHSERAGRVLQSIFKEG